MGKATITNILVVLAILFAVITLVADGFSVLLAVGLILLGVAVLMSHN